MTYSEPNLINMVKKQQNDRMNRVWEQQGKKEWVVTPFVSMALFHVRSTDQKKSAKIVDSYGLTVLSLLSLMTMYFVFDFTGQLNSSPKGYVNSNW